MADIQKKRKKPQSLKTTNTALEIIDLLEECSDQDHPIAQTEIAKILEIDRKTVKRCFDVLPPVYQDRIVTTKKGCYIEPGDHTFDLYEIRMLIDSVLGSRVISDKQTETLIGKLSMLLNKHDRAHVSHIHAYKYWNKVDNANIFWNTEVFDDAINKKVRVSFDHNEYGLDKKLHITASYVVSPIQLVFADGRYFLIAIVDGDEEHGPRSFRIDRITNAALLDIPADKPTGGTDRVDFAAAYVEGHPYMSLGEIKSVTLRIREDSIGQLFDVFGTNVTISKTDTASDDPMVEVHLRANLNDVFLWALQNARVAEILEPHALRRRLMYWAARARERYLTTDLDLYFAALEKAAVGRPEGAKLEFSDIDLSKIRNDNYRYVDVARISLKRVNLTDIIFVIGKRYLRSFYSFENPIYDYSPLARADGLQDVSIIFSEVKNLDFVPACRCLRSLTLGGARIKDASALYQPLKPQLDCLKLFWGSEIDVERFKKYNPHTKVIIGRKEAEDRDNEIDWYHDFDARFDAYPYPLNVINEILNFQLFYVTDEALAAAEAKFAEPQVRKKFDAAFYKSKENNAILHALYEEGKSILETACDFNTTINHIRTVNKDALEGPWPQLVEDFIPLCEKGCTLDDFLSFYREKGSHEQQKDAQWLKETLEAYRLKKIRESLL